MKYKLKASHEINSNFLMELLRDRKISVDEENFFNPTESNELPPDQLDNIREAYELLKHHVLNGSRVFLPIDPDVDGYTSASLFYLAMQSYTKWGMTIEYHIPEGKEHGLKTLMPLFEGERQWDLIVCPDSSSNDYDCHEDLATRGYQILVLDHHEADHYSEHATVVNNQLSQNYSNKHLTGVGVVYKFLEYFEETFTAEMNEPKPEVPIRSYVDLVTLGQISDMASQLTFENRFLCEYGLTHINNGFFKELLAKQAFSLGDRPLTQIGVAFYITPLINALIRVGSKTEKTLLFEAFIDPYKIVESTKRGETGTEFLATQVARYCANAKSRQDREMEKAFDILNIQIMNDCLDENKIIILNGDELGVPNTLTGLCAMKVAAHYKKPVILGRTTPDGKYIKGSMRGRDGSELKDFRSFLIGSGLVEYCEGHANAAGTGLRISNIDKLTSYANETLKNINFNEKFFEADFIVKGNCSYLGDLISEMDNGRALWGQSNPEPIVIIENVPIAANEIQVIGKNKDTLKFNFNGITYIKFRAKDLIEDLQMLSGKLNLTIAGRCNMNEWMGNRTPQVLIDEIEINEMNEFDF